MSWIQVINEEDATGKLKEIYEKISKKRGKLANIMKIHSLNPDAMEKHMELYLTIMFSHSGLSREQRELIASVVSAENQCSYCITHHSEALNHYWKDTERIKRLINDFHSVDLSEKEQVMLDYVKKLTNTPNEVEQVDIENLRRVGFTDQDTLHINLITCYFNFVNRIALGLGVEFTKEEQEGYKY